MNPGVIYLFGLGAIGYGYATGRITNFIDNFKNKNKDPSHTSQQYLHPNEQTRPPPTIIVQPNNNPRNSYLLPLGCACFIGLGGYYYYIHNNGTKKVIGKVEETAEETQDLVQKSDDNNSKRFEILDSKNEDRAQNLELEIRSEQRAGFNVISQQLYCLTQVAIQTLSALASSHNKKEVNDCVNNEKLISYCDKAQDLAETILDEKHLLKSKENNLKDIKAEMQLRNNNRPQQEVVMSSNVTPGGPNSYNNPFDLNRNQQIKVVNVQDKDKRDDGEHGGDGDGGVVLSALRKFELVEKGSKIGYYVYENKNIVMLSTSIMVAMYLGNKTFNYYYYTSSSKIKQDL